jgi:putative zinc finger/helix-turn-helix YgiT family protein
MLCLRCKNERFTEKKVAVAQTFRGENFNVQALAMVCTECGWFTMTDAQADELCAITADEYRRRQGLLTSAEILACRNRSKMSQRKFAKFLGVGEASVKRWEKGMVQGRAHDELIRQKCGPVRRDMLAGRPLVVHGHFSRIKTVMVTSAASVTAREVSITASASVLTATAQVTTHIQLSDGHSWRAEHFGANDSTITSSA